MKTIVFACVLGIASAELSLPIGYHTDIGIPIASEIKKEESKPNLSRISQGWNAILGMHPFFGGLIIGLKNNLVSVCGSSLLSNTRLVTAAHCWNDGINQANQFEVVLGSLTLFSGGTRVTTNAVISHPSYNSSDLQNDIAIIIIRSIELNFYIKPITLPYGVYENSTFVGNNGNIVGFGKDGVSASITVGQRLRHAFVNTISNSECANTYGKLINNNNICTNDALNKGACEGDAGGPVYIDIDYREKILIGVISYSSPFGCEVGHPAVHVRVTSFLNWIKSNMI